MLRSGPTSAVVLVCLALGAASAASAKDLAESYNELSSALRPPTPSPRAPSQAAPDRSSPVSLWILPKKMSAREEWTFNQGYSWSADNKARELVDGGPHLARVLHRYLHEGYRIKKLTIVAHGWSGGNQVVHARDLVHHTEDWEGLDRVFAVDAQIDLTSCGNAVGAYGLFFVKKLGDTLLKTSGGTVRGSKSYHAAITVAPVDFSPAGSVVYRVRAGGAGEFENVKDLDELRRESAVALHRSADAADDRIMELSHVDEKRASSCRSYSTFLRDYAKRVCETPNDWKLLANGDVYESFSEGRQDCIGPYRGAQGQRTIPAVADPCSWRGGSFVPSR